MPKVDTQIHWFLLSHNESFSSVLNVLILDPLVSIVTANAQQGRRISVCLEKKMQEQGKSRLAVMGRSVWRKTGCFSMVSHLSCYGNSISEMSIILRPPCYHNSNQILLRLLCCINKRNQNNLNRYLHFSALHDK